MTKWSSPLNSPPLKTPLGRKLAHITINFERKSNLAIFTPLGHRQIPGRYLYLENFPTNPTQIWYHWRALIKNWGSGGKNYLKVRIRKSYGPSNPDLAQKSMIFYPKVQ